MALDPPSSSKHPATWKFGYPIYHAETRAQWRAWLEANHNSVPGVWLCSWRASADKPVCPYPDAVEEAICFGWIDSTVNVLDEQRTLQLMTPRRPKSGWTRLNRRRAADMESAGLMTDAGRRAIEVAQENGWWTISDTVEDLVEPDDLAAALDAQPGCAGSLERVSAKRAQGDALVGGQRREGTNPGAAGRDDRREGRQR